MKTKYNHPTTWKDPKGATLYSYAKICTECGTRYWPFYDSWYPLLPPK